MIAGAPEIREAENDGMPAGDTPLCPICYEEAERFYYYKGTRDVLGCEHCIDWDTSWITEV